MSATNQPVAEPSAGEAAKTAWWRAVLGEYPTGVTLITSLDENNEPIGMVVGTFTAVSQDPPMIGFMPGISSMTFAQIAANGRFCASVLGEAHEGLCRSFARRAPDRFESAEWVATPSGIPRLADAVAWFEAEIDQSLPAGDHQMVLAQVNAYGVGDADAGLPLLYLRGGYGSFSVPSLQFDVQAIGWQLRLVDQIGDRVRRFAEELDAECVVSGLARDSVIVLRAENIKGRSTKVRAPVGVSFPFAAPLAPAFAAWGSDETVKSWIENSRHLLGSVDRPALFGLLDATRQRGFAISTGRAMAEDFRVVVDNPEAGRVELARLWSAVAAETGAEGGLSPDVSSIQVPVFDAHGKPSLVFALAEFDDAAQKYGVDEVARRFVAFAHEITADTGGTVPR